MGENLHKVLLVNSEMFPYLPESPISKIGRFLPQGFQERKNEIRSFMPRYGCVNERKNQLHEVIRLSGMNIIIDDVDRPLIIKVASIPEARIQVYFIDNEDYFRRKQTVRDENGKFFADNDERAIFYARGVLETVKKLRWAPDIIHCHGWISHLIPVCLKKIYCDDPIFASSKVVTSLYDDLSDEKFNPAFASKACFGNLTEQDLGLLADEPDGTGLAKTAVKYSDGVIMGSENVNRNVVEYCGSLALPILSYDGAALENGSYVNDYNAFYDRI